MKLDDVVLSSRVRLARNRRGIPFPSAIRHDARLLDNVAYAQRAAEGFITGDMYLIGRLQPLERQSLVEKRLISSALAENTESGALLLERGERVSIMINEEDHFRAQCILDGMRLAEAFGVMETFDSLLEKVIRVAYDKTLGYLTACPTNVGTGMRASVMVFAPALTESGAIRGLIFNLKDKDYAVRGAYGEGSRAVGATYQISNRRSLGLSEKEILQGVEQCAAFIAEREELERRRLLSYYGEAVEQKVLSAARALLSSVSLSAETLAELVAECKMGVALGLLPAAPLKAFDELLERAQPASLCLWAGRELSAGDRDSVRATFACEFAKNLFSNF